MPWPFFPYSSMEEECLWQRKAKLVTFNFSGWQISSFLFVFCREWGRLWEEGSYQCQRNEKRKITLSRVEIGFVLRLERNWSWEEFSVFALTTTVCVVFLVTHGACSPSKSLENDACIIEVHYLDFLVKTLSGDWEEEFIHVMNLKK